ADAQIWVKKVDNPSAYGVVELNAAGEIVELVEKPKIPISDLAVIGIYYFKEIGDLKKELQNVIDQKLTRGGEYQINDGIKGMIAKGQRFTPGEVNEWMDCGNKEITIQTNSKMLAFLAEEGKELIAPSAQLVNTTLIPPCFIGQNVVITDSTIGPGVSVGEGTTISQAQIKHSMIQKQSVLKKVVLDQAMIGSHVRYNGNFKAVSLGDYTELI
ncbi:MAG: sugar phosphate nucleotidyltransferase, partial [Flavobacteriaceae bacterium]